MIQQNNGQNDAPKDDPSKPDSAPKPDSALKESTAPAGSAPHAATGTGAEARDPGSAHPGERANERQADTAAAASSDAGLAPGSGSQSISREVHEAVLEAETAKLRDRLLREIAETENIRKRAARDVAQARKFAIAGFVNDIVPLTDNFQRVIEAVPEQAVATDPALKSLLEGVEMTERQFLSVLEKHGVKRIIPEGEIFDPNFHQAIAQLSNPEVPAGTITNVSQAGFILGERVLRPAMVVVAQGGPKPVKTAPAATRQAEPSSSTAASAADAAAPEPSAGAGDFGKRETPPDGNGS